MLCIVKKLNVLLLIYLTHCCQFTYCTFGKEHVHIKVHVPKEHAPTIIEAQSIKSPHNVIHHFHRRPHLRSRPKKQPSKPLHQVSPHADYPKHPKNLAKPVETFVVKKVPPPPPKKFNTHTVIDQKIKSYPGLEVGNDNYEFKEHIPYDSTKYRHQDEQKHSDGYVPHLHITDDYYASQHHQHAYETDAEPAPVKEASDGHDNFDHRYSALPYDKRYERYQQQKKYQKAAAAAEAAAAAAAAVANYHTFNEDDAIPKYHTTEHYGASFAKYVSPPQIEGDFHPSPQIDAHPAAGVGYDEETDPDLDIFVPSHHHSANTANYRHRPEDEMQWLETNGYKAAYAETYNDLDSYSDNHAQRVSSGDYAAPFH